MAKLPESFIAQLPVFRRPDLPLTQLKKNARLDVIPEKSFDGESNFMQSSLSRPSAAQVESHLTMAPQNRARSDGNFSVDTISYAVGASQQPSESDRQPAELFHTCLDQTVDA